MMSLTKTYDLPLPVIASWRGVQDEVIPAQVPFNSAIPGILDATGIPYTVIRTREEFGKIGDVMDDAFSYSRPHVALVLPGAWEGEGACPDLSPPPVPRTPSRGLLRTDHSGAGDDPERCHPRHRPVP